MRPERPVLSPAAFCRDPLFASSPVPKWVFDDDTLAILAVNPAACRHYGWSEAEFLAMTLFDIRPPEEASVLERAVTQDLGKEFAYYPVVQLWRRDGERLFTEVHSTAVMFGDRPAHLTVARDVTARVKAEEELRLYAKAIEACANGVLVVDARAPDMPIVLVNPAFEKISGYAAQEIIGRNCRFLQRDDRDQPALDAMRQAIANRQTFRDVLRNYRKSGEMFWNELSLAPLFDDKGELTHYVGIQNDVTPLRVEQMQLAYRDRHDELTGLPNRRDAMEVVGTLIADCDPSTRQINVALLSIEHLHQVNDTFGYDAGDALVRDVANRALAVAFRHDAFLGRVGDEDFLLVSRDDRGASATQAAGDFLGALKAPFTVSGSPIYITASAGVATYPGSADTAPALIQRAHLAARRAKQAGRNQVVEFTSGMSEEVAERLMLSAALQTALPGRQLSLHVQPLVHVATGQLGGGEVLLRWTHPVLGLVSPARFIPLAEDSGLIVDIGSWVLQEALRLARNWRSTDLRPAPALAVNVSAVQFRRPEFVRDLLAAVEAGEIAPGTLKLEITEGVVMENPEQAIVMLKELRQAGIRISLDDFGTGHSSLGYLRQLPIDEIKIDRLFVRDVTVDAYASRLCTTIISMSRQLGLTVVAEGVETPDQAAFLKDAQCDLLQGFLFSRPLVADAFRELSANDVSWSLDGRQQCLGPGARNG